MPSLLNESYASALYNYILYFCTHICVHLYILEICMCFVVGLQRLLYFCLVIRLNILIYLLFYGSLILLPLSLYPFFMGEIFFYLYRCFIPRISAKVFFVFF